MNIYDTVHEKAFQEYFVRNNPESAKAFLGDEAEAIRHFVKDWEIDHYSELRDDSIKTDILDGVALVNSYFFIHGEDIIADWMEDPINY